MTSAADYGSPRYRVRRVPDRRSWWRTRAIYEVEMTPVGARAPAWRKTTDSPESVVRAAWGLADAVAVRQAADRVWSGGVGEWQSLFPGDR